MRPLRRCDHCGAATIPILDPMDVNFGKPVVLSDAHFDPAGTHD